jgi:hypothetical protein
MEEEMNALEKNILKAKGLSEEDLGKVLAAGVKSKNDFATIGDVATLVALTGITEDVATAIMEWATGNTGASAAVTPPVSISPASIPPTSITLDSPDAVYCTHCKTKQPPDYESGNLCHSCGKQAEPTNNCYWCFSSGPGKFCRKCGAEFVALSEFEIAVQLKRDGESMSKIAPTINAMSQEEKEQLLARARK